MSDMIVAKPTSTVWRPLRLATLVRLRWLAIVGQAVSVIVVAFGLGFPTPLVPCLTLVALSALFNLLLITRLGVARRLTNRFAAVQLAFDSLQLGGLLWLTGGLGNPFSLLLLAPVSVSATTLTWPMTMRLSVLVAAIVSVLAVSHQPLPWDPATPIMFGPVYLTGIWVALLLGVAFIAAYTNRVAHEGRQMADALAATELTLSRQQRLSALDGLAAAAAHELGTPLSTIALAAKEMRSELSDGPLADDADLIVAQAARCRAILGTLRNLGVEGDGPFDRVTVTDLVAEAVKPHEGRGISVVITSAASDDPEPVLDRNVGLLYGLGNLVENAVRHAKARVEIAIVWQATALGITITDDGDGFPVELLDRIGDPYLTAPNDGSIPKAERGGLGLGIFIAKTLLERSGAQLSFGNQSASGAATILVQWAQRPQSIMTSRL